MVALRDARLLVLGVAALGLARVTGGRLPWFLFHATAALALIALVWALWVRRCLRWEVRADRERARVGEVVQVELRLENRSPVPVPWVEVDLLVPERVASVDVPARGAALGPFGSQTLRFPVVFRRRGRHAPGPVRLAAGDGFGLFVVRREVVPEARVTVHPRVVPVGDLPLPSGQPLGRLRARHRGFQDPAELAGIRPYRPGDSPRYIHWASSARRGALFLKEFERTVTDRLTVVLDLEARAHAAGPAGESAEVAVELAASLIALGIRRGCEVGLVATSAGAAVLPPARGARALGAALDVLAGVEPDGTRPLATVLRTPQLAIAPRSTVVVITPALTAELSGVLLHLQAARRVVLMLVRGGAPPGHPVAAGTREDGLAAALAARNVPVYRVGPGDDLRRLADYRVLPARAAPGVGP